MDQVGAEVSAAHLEGEVPLPAGGYDRPELGIASPVRLPWSRQKTRRLGRRFFGILQDFKFLPGGRIQAGAGTDRDVTLFNCFVMGPIEDFISGIFAALAEGAITMQQGGGIGYDFSTLRPRGTRAKTVGTIASGPVSFMRVWDAMCGTILLHGRATRGDDGDLAVRPPGY